MFIIDGKEKEECDIISVHIYKGIINKLGRYFLPIIMLIYLAAMISNAYSSIRNKWFMDFKYISIFRILIYFGVIGFIFSVILLIIATFIPCSKDNIFISYVCQIEYKDSIFYDNFMTLKSIEFNNNFFLEIIVILPLFLFSSFLNAYFELLIIYQLDPFYLISIDCAYFLIYEIIDYCLTFSKTNLYRNIKLSCQVSSNTISLILSCIYLEIIELHFCDLDHYTRKKILERESEDTQSVYLLKSFRSSVDDIHEENIKITMIMKTILIMKIL